MHRAGRVVMITLAWSLAAGGAARAQEPTTGAGNETPAVEVGSTRPDRTLWADLGHDFSVLFTTAETYVVLGVGLGASSALHSLDHRIPSSRFNGERSGSVILDRTFEAGEVLGGTLVQFGGAVATLGLGRVFGAHEAGALGRDLIRAQILTAAMTQTLKHTVGRQRPDRSSARSFPSGHASGTFATATVLHGRYGWKVGGPAYAVASYVAASRLSENKHYLSDVVFGAAIGLAAGRAVTFDIRQTRFDLAPVAVPGGGGVRLSVGGF